MDMVRRRRPYMYPRTQPYFFRIARLGVEEGRGYSP